MDTERTLDLQFDPENPSYELIETNERVVEVAAQLAEEQYIAVDVEATGLDPYTSKLLSVQIGTPTTAYIFDPRTVDLAPLKELLEARRPLKILQNASFDYKFIKHHLDITLGNLYDTMLAERVLTTGRGRHIGLAAITKKYLDIDMDKSVRESFLTTTGELTDEQLAYGALDVLALHPICQMQMAQLKKDNLITVAHLEFQTSPVVAEMELKGILLDVPRWKDMFVEYEKKRDEAEQKIQEYLSPYFKMQQGDLFGGPAKVVNLNSPKQVMEAFQMVGIDLPSTGVAILKGAKHELADMLLEYRGYEKLISAFGQTILDKINPVSGRLHPNFQQIGADTGRFSCSNPNLQQIPSTAEFRDCFIPAEGYTFVVADYSQQELRVLAALTNDPLFMKAYKEDLDLHSLTASQMFGVPFEEFDHKNKPEHNKLRKSAKIINFGIAYGMGPGALGSLLGVEMDEAKEMLDKYVKTYKGVKKWLDAAAAQAVKQGYSTTLIGRKRWYTMPEKDDPEYKKKVGNIQRQGKNTPIQGSSADMTKYALVYIMNRIFADNLDARPILAVHDEVVVEVALKDAEVVRDIVETEMIRAGEEMLPNVPVKADAGITNVWEH